MVFLLASSSISGAIKMVGDVSGGEDIRLASI